MFIYNLVIHEKSPEEKLYLKNIKKILCPPHHPVIVATPALQANQYLQT